MKVVASATHGTGKPAPSQFGLINLLKAVAAQLIVLHHLAFYGPMADHARALFPALIDWLSSSARIAVQVFLVVGGFLAAKSLAPSGHAGYADPLRAIWRRYAKLAPAFLAATLIAAVASTLAAQWMSHDSISPPATLAQLSAHAAAWRCSISAGAWYVAIDFQLYVLMVAALWVGGIVEGKRPLAWLMPLAAAFGITLSLLYFNLDADWDNWAPYFFGSYGLGLMAWWASEPRRKPGIAVLLMMMALLPAVAGWRWNSAAASRWRPVWPACCSCSAVSRPLRWPRLDRNPRPGQDFVLGVSDPLPGVPAGERGVHALRRTGAGTAGVRHAGGVGLQPGRRRRVPPLGGRAAGPPDARHHRTGGGTRCARPSASCRPAAPAFRCARTVT
jgi:peptidoglycan/LPS O-acetylase OafA/YrhL